MSDDNLDTKPETVDELAYLKERATKLNIPFSNNISINTLREKIDTVLNKQEEEKPLSAVQAKNKFRNDLINEQLKLIRVRITNMDPKKKDLPGEIFTVANEYIGTIRKYVPYGEVTDDGYHLPLVLYNELNDRKFIHINTSKNRKTGQVNVTTSWAKEFSFEVLPQLTEKELKDLAIAQSAAGSVE